jgi:hypothetical protein
MWSVDTKLGETLDIAHAEAAANVLPMRQGPYRLNEHEAKNLEASETTLAYLQEHLSSNGAVGENVDGRHETRHVLSFASLAQNPNAISAFVETIKETGGVRGVVHGIKPDDDEDTSVLVGVAQDPTGQERGRLVVLELHVPVA